MTLVRKAAAVKVLGLAPCVNTEFPNKRGIYVINPGINGKVALVTGGGYRMHQ